MSSDLVNGIVPVATGGILALLGVAITPIISHVLLSKKELRKERIEKFEELFSLVNAHDHWADSELRRNAYGEKIEKTPAPISRAMAISAIYFPDVLEAITELDIATTNYSVWMAEAAKRRVEGNISLINERLVEAFRPYREKHIATIRKLSSYAVSKGPNL